jgi:hypothetical protein
MEMKQLAITVTVTQEDIDSGDKSCGSCPITIALRRALAQIGIRSDYGCTKTYGSGMIRFTFVRYDEKGYPVYGEATSHPVHYRSEEKGKLTIDIRHQFIRDFDKSRPKGSGMKPFRFGVLFDVQHRSGL